MTIIRELNGITPKYGKDCFFAENCVVIGDVVMGDNCSIWYSTVLRGDVHYIRIGNKVNVQDGAVIHGTENKAATDIGNNVTIGHNAIVHGCTIGDNVLIGMGAIVMDNAVVESNSIIAAGAVVTEKTHVPSGTIYAGMPAKKVKELDQEQISGTIERIANGYVEHAEWYK